MYLMNNQTLDLHQIHVSFSEATRGEVKIWIVDGHEFRKKHTRYRVLRVIKVISIHEDAFLRGMTVKIDVQK